MQPAGCLLACKREQPLADWGWSRLHEAAFCRSPTISFKAPMPERIADFHRILRQEYGVPCTVRQEKVQRHTMHLCGQMS